MLIFLASMSMNVGSTILLHVVRYLFPDLDCIRFLELRSVLLLI